MNRLTASAACILFFSFATIALATPVIIVEHPVHNFGTISEGARINHTFVIKNGGNSPLNILRVVPSCGCTAANISSKSIGPGETGEIKATFNSANFLGSITKTITVETDDPKSQRFVLTLKGMVITDVQVTPKQLDFGQMTAGTTKTVSLRVENRGSRPVKLTSVRSTMPQAVIKTEKLQLKKGESTRIQVSITPKGKEFISGYLTITTDNPNPARAEINVSITGSVK